jgi:2-keto-3-deoxy-L-rhamnonate aldolase RhmA
MPLINGKTRFLEMLDRGEKPLGIFVSLLDPASTEVLGNAGFDYVVLDNEHGRLSRIEVENLSVPQSCRAQVLSLATFGLSTSPVTGGRSL